MNCFLHFAHTPWSAGDVKEPTHLSQRVGHEATGWGRKFLANWHNIARGLNSLINLRLNKEHVFLFTILEWEWPECEMRAFFYSAFPFQNGQNAIPSILLPGAEWTECCEWKSKMADGGASAFDSNASLPDLHCTGEKIWKYFWAKWNFTSYLILPKVRGVFQWCFLQEKGNLANDCRRHEEKWLPSVGNKLWEQVEVPSSFRKCEDNNNKSGRSRHICYAMFTPASFVTQCLLVPGPRIPTGVFLCRQSELFRAFCSNHSYSRIVGKKTCPKLYILPPTPPPLPLPPPHNVSHGPSLRQLIYFKFINSKLIINKVFDRFVSWYFIYWSESLSLHCSKCDTDSS